ncbi:hypothetical protein [Anaerotignum sp.]
MPNHKFIREFELAYKYPHGIHRVAEGCAQKWVSNVDNFKSTNITMWIKV